MAGNKWRHEGKYKEVKKINNSFISHLTRLDLKDRNNSLTRIFISIFHFRRITCFEYKIYDLEGGRSNKSWAFEK